MYTAETSQPISSSRSRVDGRGLALIVLAVLAGLAVAAWLVAWNNRYQTMGVISWSVDANPGLATHPSSDAVPKVRTGLVATADNRGQVAFGRYCDSCHPGARAQSGPALRGTAFASRYTPEAFAAFVRNGGFSMPAYKAEILSDADLDAIAKYILGLEENVAGAAQAVKAAASVAAAPPAAQASAGPNGQALFERSCGGCHPGGGQGLGPTLKSSKFKAAFTSEGQLSQYLRTGSGKMPAFGADRLPDADLNAVSKYVLSLAAE